MASFSIDHHLSQCAGSSGTFAILAIDHRANLVEDMSRGRGRTVEGSEVVAFKKAAIRRLADVSTALLTDPDYGFPGLVASGVPASFGLLAPLEVTDYSVHPSRRPTTFIEDWDVSNIKMNGCSGVKLLLYYHPEAENAADQTRLVDRIVDDCRAHEIPFFLEPIVYSLDPGMPLTNDERGEAVIETARHFSARGVDVLKLEFPLDATVEPDENVWERVLERLDAACTVPWALLSAGVSFELFLRQAAAACRAGASGVIAGRAVWAEGLALEGASLDAFMVQTARPRMQALASICELYGRPWYERTSRPVLEESWYCAQIPSET